MAYSPTRVANNILERAFKEGIEVTPMKLQKILYFLALLTAGYQFSERRHKNN